MMKEGWTLTERELLARGIRRSILLRGMTEAEVARRLNTSSSTVYKWCAAHSRPRPELFGRLCRLLDVDQDDVRTGMPSWMDDREAV